jgi:hypothetical protein
MNKMTAPSSSMPYHVILFSMIFLITCGSKPLSGEYKVFDSFLNEKFIKSNINQNRDFDFKIDNIDNKRSYSYTLKFKQTSENQYFLFGVVVAKAGVLLNKDEYEAERKKIERKKSDPSVLETQFPNIGKRAMKETGFFGPGGSSYGLVFTTSDGLYDVKLVISLLLPDTIDSPEIDIRNAAQLISNAYDKHMSKN